jgi:hypothetical protein
MALVGFEPMISVGERLHTQASDSEATVIGYVIILINYTAHDNTSLAQNTP